ncbi:MAG: hypothetical protein ACYC54_10500 [Sedimentisphaerales bacterium]
MNCSRIVILIIAAFCISFSTAHAEKKLIYVGIDKPDVNSLPQIVEQMEQTPFDGWTFGIRSKNAHLSLLDGRPRKFDFTWGSWSNRVFTHDEIQSSIDSFKNAKFKKFTDNFVYLCVTPGDIDWFDSYDAVLNNVGLAALIAKEGGLKGVFFDPEEYETPLWNYQKQRDVKTKSFDEYAAQVRKRGAEVMQAFQNAYPEITILLAFGHSANYWYETTDNKGNNFSKCSSDPNKLHYADYGLLSPFLNGMVEVAGSKVKIVDGWENAYFFLRAKEFANGRAAVREKVLPFVSDKGKYSKVYQCGFGIWLDANWLDGKNRDDYPADGRKEYPGWNNKDFSRNYFQPEEIEMSLKNAFKYSDEYVWLYVERLFYYGSIKNVPDEYIDAICRAKKSIKD